MEKVAILVSTYNRKELLKQSLESLFNSFDKIQPSITVCDDCSNDGTWEYLNELFKKGDIDCRQTNKNSGLRIVINFLLEDAVKNSDYICYCQDDITYEKGWLDKCVQAWKSQKDTEDAEKRDGYKPYTVGFVTGHDAPEHPIKAKGAIYDTKVCWKDTCRATHLFASTERWKEFGEIPDLTPGVAAPKPGQGSMVDWWLVGHPERKYPESRNSLQNKGEKVLCIPGLIKHIGDKASTWGIQTPERKRLIPNRIGVQIITRGRSEYLTMLLASLRNQTIQNFDIYIVDNSDKPVTDVHHVRAILERMMWEGHRVILSRDSTRDIGYLRNIALDMDENEIGIRIDDDSICEPDMLEKLYKCLTKYDKVGCVGPMVPFMHQEKLYKELPPKMCRMSKFYDVTDESIWFFNTKKEAVPADHIRSSMMYWNDVAKKIRHPEGFGRTGFREETVFSYRFKIHGYQNYYVPTAVCWHFAAPTGGGRDVNEDGQTLMYNNDQKMKELLSKEEHEINKKTF